MDDRLELQIVSQDRVEFSGEVEYVSLPAETGLFRVLPRHAPVIASLVRGDITFMFKGAERSFHVNQGFAELCGDKMTVLL